MTAKPFRIELTQDAVDDLKQRLLRTRWPDAELVSDWSQGAPLRYLQQFCGYWAKEYDFAAAEKRLNAFPQFKHEVNGVELHFVHVRSAVPSATPLILSHGWPGSVLEFSKVIASLVDPLAHGGKQEDAFHVVIPSLPGYGFSGKPRTPGWGIERIAETWDALMVALGYDSYVANGGDWGAAVTTYIGVQDRGHCKGIHLNMPFARPPQAALQAPGPEDMQALGRMQHYLTHHAAYFTQHMTGSQTIGYSLVDSPVGLAAWILEKFQGWSDCNGNVESVFTRDELIDNLMLYWLPATGASAARLYGESFQRMFLDDSNMDSVSVPTGISQFPHEVVPLPRSWAGSRYKNIKYWNELSSGGHFAAMEKPQLFVDELRSCFRALRGA